MLSDNYSSSILLWSKEFTWYSPLPKYTMETVLGLLRLSLDTTLPSEFKLRWLIQTIIRRADHDRNLESKLELETYMAKPYKVGQEPRSASGCHFPSRLRHPAPSST